ncbi:MAG: DUF2150 family protein [Halobacteriales archaeon]|nr:DUF2150 family protein [Halobacteriales archaeon]
MSTPAGEFYTEERWDNWLDRLRSTELDPSDEDSARLLLNLQDDVAIAVAKIVSAAEDELGEGAALEELGGIRDIVLGPVEIEDEETAILVDGVQTSLVAVFFAAEQYVADGVTDDESVEAYLRDACEAEQAEEFDEALQLTGNAGTQVIDGEALDIAVLEEFEYGLVTEWTNGLDSLQSALSDPEVIEE